MFFCLLLISIFFANAQSSPLKNMAEIPAGSFIPLYGNDTVPVYVNSFYMDKYPVTNEEFLTFVEKYPKWSKFQVKPIFADANYLKHWDEDIWKDQNSASMKNSPVVNISWFAAKFYCESQNKHLPTDDQWEYVAVASEAAPDGTNDSSCRQKRIRQVRNA